MLLCFCVITFLNNSKVAYVFAAIPARYALERKEWKEAAQLETFPANFPWDKFGWENAITHFTKALGSIHTSNLEVAKKELMQLELIRKNLAAINDVYKANQVQIQINSVGAWIQLTEGDKKEAVKLMTVAADMEDATSKNPVTPGEVVPARELLGEMYMVLGEFTRALEAYEADLQRHPNRFNCLAGAARAAEKLMNNQKTTFYLQKLVALSVLGESKRPELKAAAKLLKVK